MKKSVKLLALVMSFFAVSCVESLVNPETDMMNDGDTVTLTLHSAASTKTTLVDDTHVRWEEGDRIYINGTPYDVRLDANDPGKAYVDKVASDTCYTAYYSNGGSYMAEGLGLVINMRSYQEYKKGSFGQFANTMVAQSKTTDLHFYNAASILKLGITGDAVIKHVAISSNNNEPLSGYFVVTDETLKALDKDFEGVQHDGEMSKNNYVNVRVYEEEGLQLSSTPEYIYAVVPPQTYEKGLTVSVVDMEGRVGIQTTSKSITTTRSNITTMADFNFEAADALTVELTPGQTNVDVLVKGQAGALVSNVVVLKEVWDSMAERYPDEQTRAGTILNRNGVEFSVSDEPFTQTLFANLGNQLLYMAAGTDYKVLTSYSSGGYPVGNIIISDFTSLEATGTEPELTVEAAAAGSDVNLVYRVSEETVSVQHYWEQTSAIEEKLAAGYTLSDVVNMWGLFMGSNSLNAGKTEDGAKVVYKNLDYDQTYTFILKAVTATGAEKIIRLDVDITAEQAPVVATATQIKDGADGTVYTIEGYVGDIENGTYGNYYLSDHTGSIYIYGTLNQDGESKKFMELGINAGDIITVTGPKLTYNSKTELTNVTVNGHKPVTDKTVAEFLETPESSDVYYRLTGKVTNLVMSGDSPNPYGNFDIVDETGSVYVYGLLSGWGGPKKQFLELGINEGDLVTIVGNHGSYGDTQEVLNAFYVSHVPAESFEEPTVATVAEFLEAEVGDRWYKLTGRIQNIVMDKTDTTLYNAYGNFDLVDDTGSVYVYGLTAAKADKNDQSFNSLGLKEGDVLTLVGKRAVYKDVPQVGGPAYYVSHEAGETPEEPEVPTEPENPVEPENPGEVTEAVLKMSELWSEDFNFSDGETYNLSGIASVTFTKNNSSNSHYNAGDQGLRWYASDILKFKFTNAVSRVEFVTYGGKNGPLTADIGTMDASGLVWTGNAAEITFTASAQIRVSEIKITYAGGAPGTPDTPTEPENPEEPGTPAEPDTPDTPGSGDSGIATKGWMELPDMTDKTLEYYTHDFTLNGKEHRNYTFGWSQDDYVSLWVAYPLSPFHMESVSGRTDEWAYDPLLGSEKSSAPFSNYGDEKGSGVNNYDRGHQVPSSDRLCCVEANNQTFYGTNMTPQMPDLNQKAWKNLEEQVKDWANAADTVYVVTGCVLEGSTEQVPDSDSNMMTVPTGYYKALLRYDASATDTWSAAAFFMEHRSYGDSKDFESVSMSIDELEQKVGIDFFVNLPAKVGADKAKSLEAEDPVTSGNWF